MATEGIECGECGYYGRECICDFDEDFCEACCGDTSEYCPYCHPLGER